MASLVGPPLQSLAHDGVLRPAQHIGVQEAVPTAPLSSVAVRGWNSGRSAALPRLTGRDPRRLTPVSNPSADLRTPVPAASVAVRATWRAPGITMVSVLLILALVSAEAARRGPWLDEFWALELSDYHNGLWSLIRDGWLHDVHPPAFNAWTTLLAGLEPVEGDALIIQAVGTY